jgi:hypothetical protein
MAVRSAALAKQGQIQQFQRAGRELVEEKTKPQQLSWGFVYAIPRQVP